MQVSIETYAQDGGFGYRVLFDGEAHVDQPFDPSVPGVAPFATEAAARAHGEEPFLDAVRAERAAELEASCYTQIAAGFDSSAVGAAHHYPGAPDDQTNLLGTLMLAQASGQSQPFRCTPAATGERAWVSHTPSQMAQVVADGAAYKGGCIATLATRQATLAAAQTLAEVYAVSW